MSQQWAWPLVWYQPWHLAGSDHGTDGEAMESCGAWKGNNGTSPLDLRTSLKFDQEDDVSKSPPTTIVSGGDFVHDHHDVSSAEKNASACIGTDHSPAYSSLITDDTAAANGGGCPRLNESYDSSDSSSYCWYRCTNCSFSSCDMLQFYVHLVTHEAAGGKGAGLRRPYDCSVCGYHDDAAEKVKRHILDMSKDGHHHRACVQPPLSTIVLKCADYYAAEMAEQENGGKPSSLNQALHGASEPTFRANSRKLSGKVRRKPSKKSTDPQSAATARPSTILQDQLASPPISVTYKCCRCGARSLAKRVIAHHLLRTHGIDKMDTFCCTSCKTRYDEVSSLWWHFQQVHVGKLAEAVVICDGHRPPEGAEGLAAGEDASGDEERLVNALEVEEGFQDSEGQTTKSTVKVGKGDDFISTLETGKTGICQNRLRSLLLGGTTAVSVQKNRQASVRSSLPTETKNRKRPYNCTKCPTSFCGVVAWKMHKRLHGAMFPFKCTQCDYAVRNRGNLSWHLKLHAKHNGFRQG